MYVSSGLFDEAWKRVAGGVFHKMRREASGLSRLVDLWKDRLSASGGRPDFGAWKSGGLTPP